MTHLLGHWPPHLGVRTDAEKVQYLADRLREAARDGDIIDQLNDKISALEEENAFLQSDNESLKDRLAKIRELT